MPVVTVDPPFAAPRFDQDGEAFVYVVLVGYAGGPQNSAHATFRDKSQAEAAASALEGRVLRVPYYDNIPREPLADGDTARGHHPCP